MIMMGLKFTGHVPFGKVWMHSIVRNAEGQKMSKSKGTGIDPVEMNEKYGTDAMRFTLAIMAAPGTDIVLTEDRILSYRAFANKIWNAARFVFMNLDKYETAGGETLEALASPEVRAAAPYAAGGEVALIDRWIFSRLAGATAQVNDALTNFRFHEAAHVVYHFFWGDFCDWYIEWVKPELLSADRSKAAATWKNLFAAFESALRLLHPFMPFLTEELWHQLPQREGARSIALDRFPEPHQALIDLDAEFEMEYLQDIIVKTRNMRAEIKIDPKQKVPMHTYENRSGQIGVLEKPAIKGPLNEHLEAVLRLAILSNVIPESEPLDPAMGPVRSGPQPVRTGPQYEIGIRYGATNVPEEIQKIQKELERLTKDIASKQLRLEDQTFRSRAPEHIVKGLESTLAEREAELAKLKERLATLEKNL
jgi:valyl-tRNA synthetase